MPINAGDTTAEVKATIDQIIEDAGLDPADNTDTTAATSMLNEIAVLYDLPGLTGRMGGAAAREVINNLEEGGGVGALRSAIDGAVLRSAIDGRVLTSAKAN